MNSAVIPISNWQLSLTVILVLLAGGVSAALKLGLLRSLLWGTVRTFVQLTLVGFVLKYVFAWNSLPAVVTVIILMTLVATQAATKRTTAVPSYPKAAAFFSLLVSTLLVGTVVVALIIGPDPWYSARVAIPILGMILGNSMNGVALSLDRLYGTVKSHLEEVEELLAFGATPWEAVRSSVREAVRAGMTPTINSLMVVGLVSLPGMMTGQILGGADPQEAVRYQIVVMLMIAAAVAIGCVLLVGLSYRRLFTSDSSLISELYNEISPVKTGARAANRSLMNKR